jgi:hypothetical protein
MKFRTNSINHGLSSLLIVFLSVFGLSQSSARAFSLTDLDPTNPNSAIREGMRDIDPTNPNSAIREGMRDVDPTNPNSAIREVMRELDVTLPGSAANEAAALEFANLAYPYFYGIYQKTMIDNGRGEYLTDFQKIMLRPYFGSLVDDIIIHYNANLANEFSIAGHRYHVGDVQGAMSFCDHIFMQDPKDEYNFTQLSTLAHELVHTSQCHQVGGVEIFLHAYLFEYARALFSYYDNRAEVSAFAIEESLGNDISQRLNNYIRTEMSRLFVVNNCRYPITLAITYLGSFGEWKTDGWWELNGNASSFLTDQVSHIRPESPTIYYYVEISDGPYKGYSLNGDLFRTLYDRSIGMRQYQLQRDFEEDYEMIIDCDALD